MRLYDAETRISGARRAATWEPLCRGFGIAKILKSGKLRPRQSRHPADVGLHKVAYIPSGPNPTKFKQWGSPMADHPHPRAHNKPTLAHHWNHNKYQANLVAGAQILERGHVGFGSSVRKGKFDHDFWEVVGFTNLPEQDPRLQLIHGKKPADAIDAMFQHPERWSFDCAEFVQAVDICYSKHRRCGCI